MNETIKVPMELSLPEFSIYTYVTKEQAEKIIKVLDRLKADIEKQIAEQS